MYAGKKTPNMVYHVYINGNVALNPNFAEYHSLLGFIFILDSLSPKIAFWVGNGNIDANAGGWATETLMCVGNGSVC